MIINFKRKLKLNTLNLAFKDVLLNFSFLLISNNICNQY